jgi:dihydroceramidase
MMKYWEPHTSSIDFCETNYQHSDFVVELHNTWSSILGISLFGIVGLVYGNPTKELRFTINYSILVVIGVGSAFLHGTLHWAFQSSDELPMLYLMASYIYIILELEGGGPQQQRGGKGRTTLLYPKLPSILMMVLLGITIVYYTFQDLYLVFVVSYISSLFIHFSMIGSKFYKGHEHTKHPITRDVFKLSILSYVIVASPIWVLDMLCCQFCLDYIASYMVGITPHVVWHFTAGYGAYVTAVYLESFRLQALKKEFHAKYLMGFVPILLLGKECMKRPIKNSHNAKED